MQTNRSNIGALIGGALLLASYLAVRRRSRRGLVALEPSQGLPDGARRDHELRHSRAAGAQRCREVNRDERRRVHG